MRIGLMTGGGDAPGLNSVLEACSLTLIKSGAELVGIQDGFQGVFDGRHINVTMELVKGRHSQAGTLLGTSNKVGTKGRESEFIQKIRALKLDGLIAIGGDGTFAGLKAFESEINIVGVPKTIDNDLPGTDITFGFDTACSVVAESVDALRATAHAHSRVIIVEAMGRTAGWIALGGGLASYAEAILIPERPYDPQALWSYLKEKKKAGERGLVIVASEGAHAVGEKALVAHRVEGSPEPDRLGGIAEYLARKIEKEVNWESRHVVLGHLQRSRAPSATDRFLTLSMGVTAAKLVLEKKWGHAAVYKNGIVSTAPITELMKGTRLVDPDHRWVKVAQAIGSFI